MFTIYTINHRIQPLMRKLNAILGAHLKVIAVVNEVPSQTEPSGKLIVCELENQHVFLDKPTINHPFSIANCQFTSLPEGIRHTVDGRNPAPVGIWFIPL